MSGFYDNSPVPARDGSAATRSSPDADKQLTHEVYGKPSPAAEKAQEDEKPARSEFAANVMPYGPQVAQSVQRAAESVGEDAETAQASAAAWSQAFDHFGIPEAHIDHLVSAGLQVASGPPDEATAKAWTSEAHQRLASEYGGPDGGARALETARAWVQAHPGLVQFLDRTGLGNHPRVVAAIAATARQAQQDGKVFNLKGRR